MAQGHDHGTDNHGTAVPQPAVRQVAAEDRRQVDQRGIGGIDLQRMFTGKADGIDQIEHQQGTHTVITEALPHLGEEQGREAVRMVHSIQVCLAVWGMILPCGMGGGKRAHVIHITDAQ